jgi:DNA-binding transcriptional LysR family regulator
VRLFERMNRRVYLTEAGRTLRQYADTVLSQFQESVEVLRDILLPKLPEKQD